MSKWHQLSQLCGCQIEGPDAVAFCQSQFTADVEAMPLAQWQICGWCDRKGRVRMVILTARYKDHVEIIMPTIQKSLLGALSMFTIGRSVKLIPVDNVSGAYRSGEDAGSNSSNYRVIKDDPFSRMLKLDGTEGSETRDSARAPDVDWLQTWASQDVRMPLPWLDPRTQDRFLPQALGMEANGGLSFTKGCYPGQEIVARVHYLGRAPEQLVALSVDSSTWNSGNKNSTSGLSAEEFSQIKAAAKDGGRVSLLSTVEHAGNCLMLAVAPSKLKPGDTVEIKRAEKSVLATATPFETLC